MKTVLEIVSFIHSSAMTLQQFRYFVELEEDITSNGVNYHSIVRWLSTINVLKRLVDLFETICTS